MQRHFRHEFKYEITASEYYESIPRIRAVMIRDRNSGGDGEYRVNSIYFDNYRDKAVREKISGISSREKFRIRWYNDDLSFIRLEKKMKEKDLCNKVSAGLTEAQFRQILQGDIEWMKDAGESLIREFYIKRKIQKLRPRVKVSYLREAYVFVPGNVRVTFDKEISSTLFHQYSDGTAEAGTDMRIRPGHMVMEVKYDEYIPEIISMILQTGNNRRTAFSKYVACRSLG